MSYIAGYYTVHVNMSHNNNVGSMLHIIVAYYRYVALLQYFAYDIAHLCLNYRMLQITFLSICYKLQYLKYVTYLQ